MTPSEERHAPADELYQWIEAETGMDFSGERVTRVRDAVQKVLTRQRIRMSRIARTSEQRGPFLEKVTAELTIGESFFFRNEHHFRALRDHVIPEILKDNASQREVRIWSAGCAGGEEPYSLAILLDQILAGTTTPTTSNPSSLLAPWHISVLGTDLNPEFLERARAARFRPWSFRQTNIQQDTHYFTQHGDEYRLAPRIRERVRFAYLNLVKDCYPSPLTGTLGLDLILFRNVAIYLKSDVTRAIVERFYRALRPGGWLLLGESEVGNVITGSFEVRRFEQATLHQKPRIDAAPGATANAPGRPVLADFLTNRRTLQRQSVGLSQAPPVIPAVPELPEWVPLPKQKSIFRPPNTSDAATRVTIIEGTAFQQIEKLVVFNRLAEAERLVERIASRRDRAAARLLLVHALLARADGARARRMLGQTLQEEPLLLEAQLLQASLAEEAGNWDEAEQAYRRALYIDRNCPLTHFHLALVQQQVGQAEVARRSLTTTLSLIDKQDPHALVPHGDGVCYGRLKEMAETILNY